VGRPLSVAVVRMLIRDSPLSFLVNCKKKESFNHSVSTPSSSSSLNTKYSGPSADPLPSFTGTPPNSGSSTLSPALTPTGISSPVRDLRPGPTATTDPSLICGVEGANDDVVRAACGASRVSRTRGVGRDRPYRRT
jgi:hypothetical protein